MMVSVWFRLTRSLTRNCQVIEVWYKDRFVATITPPPENMLEMAAITVISKHLHTDSDGIVFDVSPIPSLVVRFDPFVD